ncbi:hypothetical protein L2E82_50154 [Cichorium intybus]|nr:hypothetical protein L2E82_50154 [Cichorium intybus]
MIPVELRILAFWDLVVLTVGMESNTWNERVVIFNFNLPPSLSTSHDHHLLPPIVLLPSTTTIHLQQLSNLVYLYTSNHHQFTTAHLSPPPPSILQPNH